MAVIGHWNSLTEAQRLTQSVLIPGVIEEDIKRNNLLDRLPVAQSTGKSIKWNREVATISSYVKDIDIGEQLSWSSSVTYDPQETELKRCYVQRVLDDFIADVYGNINDYEATMLWEMKKGMVRRLGEKLWYDDISFGPGLTKEFDGLHALAADQTGTDLDIDNGEVGLSLDNLRKMIDAMKHGCDAIYMPYCIARRMDEAYQERGIGWSARFGDAGTAMYNLIGAITVGWDDAGKRIMFFDGIPIVRTDFLLAEKLDTGENADLRTVWTHTDDGDKQYSIFGIKFGDVFNQEPGLQLAFGNTQMVGQFYKIVPFSELEDYDASGLRLVSYVAPILGSKLCLGRIFDIEDVAVTA